MKTQLQWPLGINPEMDRNAANAGLSHWSCVSPKSNEAWVRRDGELHIAKFDMTEGYPAELRRIDAIFPIGNDWRSFETPETCGHVPPRPIPEPSKDQPIIPQPQPERRMEMKEILLWTLAGAALTAALIYGATQLLNSVSTTMPAEMPLMQGDG